MKRAVLLSLGLIFLFVVQTSAAGLNEFSGGATQPIKAVKSGIVSGDQANASFITLDKTNTAPQAKASLSVSPGTEPGIMLMLGAGLLFLSGLIRKREAFK